jgi:FtsH-binding integral membrane protein
MLWLIFCAFFLVMLFSIFRMLNQRGKWAWVLFLGLIASVGVYVALIVLSLASSGALHRHRGWLAALLVGGTLLYAGALIYFVRRMVAKMKIGQPPPN